MKIQFDRVAAGCQVVIELVDRTSNRERLKVVIVPDQDADYAHGYLGENTPLAKAILGEKTGTTIPYLKDDITSIQILSVSNATTLPPKDMAERRKAKMNKAVREVEDTNAMVFASSFSGKWGDYDPDSIPKEDKPEEEN